MSGTKLEKALHNGDSRGPSPAPRIVAARFRENLAGLVRPLAEAGVVDQSKGNGSKSIGSGGLRHTSLSSSVTNSPPRGTSAILPVTSPRPPFPEAPTSTANP